LHECTSDAGVFEVLSALDAYVVEALRAFDAYVVERWVSPSRRHEAAGGRRGPDARGAAPTRPSGLAGLTLDSGV
jgi:hypothetical protein